jgi:hypothetical protein
MNILVPIGWLQGHPMGGLQNVIIFAYFNIYMVNPLSGAMNR